jgi:hypothetical protein
LALEFAKVLDRGGVEIEVTEETVREPLDQEIEARRHRRQGVDFRLL